MSQLVLPPNQGKTCVTETRQGLPKTTGAAAPCVRPQQRTNRQSEPQQIDRHAKSHRIPLHICQETVDQPTDENECRRHCAVENPLHACPFEREKCRPFHAAAAGGCFCFLRFAEGTRITNHQKNKKGTNQIKMSKSSLLLDSRTTLDPNPSGDHESMHTKAST